MHLLRLISLLATISAGCAATPAYLYAPEGATLWGDGRPIAVSPIPPEAPRGDVQLSSFGITELTPDGVNPVEALHVRMLVTNNGDDPPWTIDTGEVVLDLAGAGRSRAIFVNTDVVTLPVVSIARGERKTLDFYFPVPADVSDERALPAFDVLWQVITSVRPFASRTTFRAIERFDEQRTSMQVVLVSGWGPFWWFNPVWAPGPVFVHPRPIAIRHPPTRVIVTRPPRWYYRPAPPRHHRR
jgi:hypothetical protein